MYDGATTRKWVATAKQNVKWLIILGIVQVVLGMIAIASPLVTGIVVSIFVGACLLGCGVGRMIQAFKADSWGAGLLGAAVGAGVGMAASAATEGQQVVITEGTVIQFRLEEALTVPIAVTVTTADAGGSR